MKRSTFEGLVHCALTAGSIYTPILVGWVVAWIIYCFFTGSPLTGETFEAVKGIGLSLGVFLVFPMPWLLSSEGTAPGLFSASDRIADIFYGKEFATGKK